MSLCGLAVWCMVYGAAYGAACGVPCGVACGVACGMACGVACGVVCLCGQLLEQVVSGSATQGLRVRLLQKYNSYLGAHDMVEAAITADELRDCARQVVALRCLACKDETRTY